MIEKSDFKVGGRFEGDRRRNDPYGIHFNSGPATYRYRVPIGKDEDGNLIYSDYDREVQDTDWIFPVEIYRRTRYNPRALNLTSQEYNSMRGNDPRMMDAQVSAIIRQVMDTASHEAGHTAHKLADPEEQNWRWDEKMANRERGGYGLFDYDSDSMGRGVGEHVAYTSEYPHNPGIWGRENEIAYHKGMRGHPDVPARMAQMLGNPIKFSLQGKYRRDPRRNLINAILDQTATTGVRTGAGNFQFGDLDKKATRKKQAERESRDLINRIWNLGHGTQDIKSFADLPQDIQEGIGRLQLREQLSQFMENMHRTHRQETLDTSNYDPDSQFFAAANPEMFFENYDAVPYEWEARGRYGTYHLANDALSAIPTYGYGENQELLEALKEKFGEPTQYQEHWALKPKVKSNPYMRTPMQYLDPRFGSESVLQDIMDEYAVHEAAGYDFDSSRAFMKSWGMMR